MTIALIRELKADSELSSAIRNKDTLSVKRIINRDVNRIRYYCPIGSGTWLSYASSEGAIDIVKLLFDSGIGLNEVSLNSDRTALNEACSSGQLEVVKFLLKEGVNISVKTARDNQLFDCVPGFVMDQHPVHGSDTPSENYLKIAELLLDHGIDYSVRYNTETMQNMDAMAFACMWGRQDIARLIAERKADGDAQEVERLLSEAEQIAEDNTEPVPEGETVRPS